MLILVSFVTVTSAVSSEVYKSISPGGGINPIVKHLLMLSVGVCMAVCVSIFSGRTLRYMLPKSYFLVMCFLFVVQFFLGADTNGAERWIRLGPMTLQPSEFYRIFLVLWGAYVAGKDTEEDPRKEKAYWWYWARVLALSSFVLVTNLSTFLIFFVFLYLYSWVLKAPKRFMYRVSAIGLSALILGGAYLYLAPESMLPGRAVTWHNRLHGAVNESLSQAYSDYLYAIIIEEYGLLGLLFIPSLYFAWMLIGYREARKQTNVYRSNLIKGFGILYPMQALVNMIVASGIITTGQTLPLISYGGSSIIATSIAFGIMIAASKADKPKRTEALASVTESDQPAHEEVYPTDEEPSEVLLTPTETQDIQ